MLGNRGGRRKAASPSDYAIDGWQRIVILLVWLVLALWLWARWHPAALDVATQSSLATERPFYRTATAVHSKDDVAIATHLTLDRFASLEAMAAAWGGSISATIYITKDHHIRQVDRLHAVSSNVQRLVDLHLVIVDDPEYNNYSSNKMRNRAIDWSRCNVVVMLDVDFVPDTLLRSEIKRNLGLLYESDDGTTNKRALVIPAFEFTKRALEDAARKPPSALPSTVRELRALYQQQLVMQVHLDKSELAHRPTNYSAWQTASKPYRVEYDYMWEPYVVVRKDHHQAVRYDERFVGYGNDKTSYTLELLAAGFEFVVLPESFILHVEHGTPRWRKHASFNYLMPWRRWVEFLHKLEDTYDGFTMAVPQWFKDECERTQSCPAFWSWR